MAGLQKAGGGGAQRGQWQERPRKIGGEFAVGMANTLAHTGNKGDIVIRHNGDAACFAS